MSAPAIAATAPVTTADEFTQTALFAKDCVIPAVPVAPAYDEAARAADRELCQRYFRSWCKTAGKHAGSRLGDGAGHPTITFAEFQAAADRLAA